MILSTTWEESGLRQRNKEYSKTHKEAEVFIFGESQGAFINKLHLRPYRREVNGEKIEKKKPGVRY